MHGDVAFESSAATDGEYNVAGWLAIAAAVLTLPMFGFGLAMDIASHRVPKVALLLLVPYVIVSLAQLGFGLFAFARFRDFLNRRHAFHEVDALIYTIIIGVIVIFLIALPSRILTILGILEGPFVLIPIVAIAVVGISLGILGEYLWRTFDEARGRPRYIVEECVRSGQAAVATKTKGPGQRSCEPLASPEVPGTPAIHIENRTDE